LAEAVRSNNVAVVMRAMEELAAARRRQQQELAALHADPLNPANQRRIEAMLRQQQVNENYENAVEHNPIGFARVIMLYIPVSVNGVPLKAFVDSGAQSTIMSERVARQCNLGHLIDTRFSGIAKGVGACKIVGRVVSSFCVALASMRVSMSIYLWCGGVCAPSMISHVIIS
jgi:DNA damage-inducible protein 1